MEFVPRTKGYPGWPACEMREGKVIGDNAIIGVQNTAICRWLEWIYGNISGNILYD